MADVTWGAGLIILKQQGGFGVIEPAVRDADGPITEAEGAVLGLATGTGESGITVPTHVREALEKPDVPGTFTRTPNAFVRSSANGLQIEFDLKGNGDVYDGAAVTGEAKPPPGVDAIFEAAGLEGSNVLQTYKYVPSDTTTYATVRLFLGNATEGLAYTYQDCVVETLTLPNEGGEGTPVTASITIGSIFEVVTLSLPSFNYGNQATTPPPINQLSEFTWGTERCHQTFEVSIANTVEEFSCSNAANGKRLDQSDRTIGFDGSVMVESTNTIYEWQQLIGTPSASATWAFGPGADAPNPDAPATDNLDIFNRVNYSCNNLVVENLSYDRAGSKMTAEVDGRCSAISGGGEFTLLFE